MTAPFGREIALRDLGTLLEGWGMEAPRARAWSARLEVRALLLQGLDPEEVDLLVLLAADGEVQVLRGPEGQALVVGSRVRLQELIAALDEAQAPELAAVLDRALLGARGKPRELAVGGRTFRWGERTYVMGILNVTPDSFSGDGLLQEEAYVAAALARARAFAEAGADLLDVGGESTRPGAEPVSLEEELRRVVPVVRALTAELDLPISVDTYKPEVARAALEAGAHLINDVWGMWTPEGTFHEAMARVALEFEAPVILMHNRRAEPTLSELGGYYRGVEYADLMGEIAAELLARARAAEAFGIPRERIVLDPGIGFAKTPEQNLQLLRRLPELASLGYPLLVGPSRKSFIGLTLNLPPEERLEGTLAALALCVAGGADLVRVHDVREAVRAVRLADAVVRG